MTEQKDELAEYAELFAKYPSLKQAFETGIEFDDGREEELLVYILSHPNFSTIKGSPIKLLAAMDEFSASLSFLISVGPHKSGVLSDLIKKEKPTTVVELGGYLGYSAILFADTMKRVLPSTNLKVYSLEMSERFAGIARQFIEIAGLSDVITVVVGPAEESLKSLEVGKGGVDFLFLDHVEDLYVSDFKVVEGLGLLRKGACVVADNVVRPGAPEYRTYVRSHTGLKSEGVRGLIQPGDLEDELEISYTK